MRNVKIIEPICSTGFKSLRTVPEISHVIELIEPKPFRETRFIILQKNAFENVFWLPKICQNTRLANWQQEYEENFSKNL